MKLPDSAYIHYNYVERDTLPPEYQSNYHIDYASANFLNYSLKDSDPIKFWAMKKQSDKSLKKSWFLSSIERNDLIGIQSHYLDDDPVPYVKKNGCCIPGHQRLYITTQGDFKVCERVGNTPFIGSLNEGLNIENIKSITLMNMIKNLKNVNIAGHVIYVHYVIHHACRNMVSIHS